MEILKKVLQFFGKEEEIEVDSRFTQIIKESLEDYERKGLSYSFKVTQLDAWEEVIKPLPDKVKCEFIFFLCDAIYAYSKFGNQNFSRDNGYIIHEINQSYFTHLFRIKIAWKMKMRSDCSAFL